MKTLLFVLWTVLRIVVPLGLLVGTIWWLANGAGHPARFWWIVGGVFFGPGLLYLPFAAWFWISRMRERRRNLREAERRERAS